MILNRKPQWVRATITEGQVFLRRHPEIIIQWRPDATIPESRQYCNIQISHNSTKAWILSQLNRADGSAT